MGQIVRITSVLVGLVGLAVGIWTVFHANAWVADGLLGVVRTISGGACGAAGAYGIGQSVRMWVERRRHP